MPLHPDTLRLALTPDLHYNLREVAGDPTSWLTELPLDAAGEARVPGFDLTDIAELAISTAIAPSSSAGLTRHEVENETGVARRVLAAIERWSRRGVGGESAEPGNTDTGKDASRGIREMTVLTRAEVAALAVRTTIFAFRMGPVRVDGSAWPPPPEPVSSPQFSYPHHRIGMCLSSSAAQVWEAARGHWRALDDADYFIPTRFGYAPYVFRVIGWRTDAAAGRICATGGYLIEGSGADTKLSEMRLVDGAPTPGASLYVADPESDEPVRPEDRIVGELAGNVLALGKRGANPVIRIKSRTTSRRRL